MFGEFQSTSVLDLCKLKSSCQRWTLCSYFYIWPLWWWESGFIAVWFVAPCFPFPILKVLWHYIVFGSRFGSAVVPTCLKGSVQVQLINRDLDCLHILCEESSNNTVTGVWIDFLDLRFHPADDNHLWNYKYLDFLCF